jgi:hypothetical protein
MKSLLFLLLITSHTAFAKVCFDKNTVRDFDSRGATELHLFTSNSSEYKLTTEPCFNMMFTTRIEFQTYPLNSSQVCPGDDVVATDPDGKTDSCNIRNIEKVK